MMEPWNKTLLSEQWGLCVFVCVCVWCVCVYALASTSVGSGAPKHPQLFEDFWHSNPGRKPNKMQKIFKVLKSVNVKEKKRPNVLHGPITADLCENLQTT